MAGIKGVSDLSKRIEEVLKVYTDEVAEDVNKAARDCAKGLSTELRRVSPKRTGRYGKDWTVKEKYISIRDISCIVHNRKEYRLTHLLENGHGGPIKGVSPSTPPHVHIGPSAEKWKKEFIRRCEEACKR